MSQMFTLFFILLYFNFIFSLNLNAAPKLAAVKTTSKTSAAPAAAKTEPKRVEVSTNSEDHILQLKRELVREYAKGNKRSSDFLEKINEIRVLSGQKVENPQNVNNYVSTKIELYNKLTANDSKKSQGVKFSNNSSNTSTSSVASAKPNQENFDTSPEVFYNRILQLKKEVVDEANEIKQNPNAGNIPDLLTKINEINKLLRVKIEKLTDSKQIHSYCMSQIDIFTQDVQKLSGFDIGGNKVASATSPERERRATNTKKTNLPVGKANQPAQVAKSELREYVYLKFKDKSIDDTLSKIIGSQSAILNPYVILLQEKNESKKRFYAENFQLLKEMSENLYDDEVKGRLLELILEEVKFIFNKLVENLKKNPHFFNNLFISAIENKLRLIENITNKQQLLSLFEMPQGIDEKEFQGMKLNLDDLNQMIDFSKENLQQLNIEAIYANFFKVFGNKEVYDKLIELQRKATINNSAAVSATSLISVNKMDDSKAKSSQTDLLIVDNPAPASTSQTDLLIADSSVPAPAPAPASSFQNSNGISDTVSAQSLGISPINHYSPSRASGSAERFSIVPDYDYPDEQTGSAQRPGTSPINHSPSRASGSADDEQKQNLNDIGSVSSALVNSRGISPDPGLVENFSPEPKPGQEGLGNNFNAPDSVEYFSPEPIRPVPKSFSKEDSDNMPSPEPTRPKEVSKVNFTFPRDSIGSYSIDHKSETQSREMKGLRKDIRSNSRSAKRAKSRSNSVAQLMSSGVIDSIETATFESPKLLERTFDSSIRRRVHYVGPSSNQHQDASLVRERSIKPIEMLNGARSRSKSKSRFYNKTLINALFAQIDKLKAENAELQEKIEQKKQDFAGLIDTLLSEQIVRKDLEIENLAFLEELNRLRVQEDENNQRTVLINAGSEIRVFKMQEELARFQVENDVLANLKNRLAEKTRLIEEVQAANTEIEIEKARLNSEHNESVARLAIEIKAVKSELEAANARLAEAQAAKVSELQELQAEHDAVIASLNLDVDAARSELDAVKQNAEVEKVRLQAEHDALVTSLAAANERLRESDEARANLQEANGAVSARLAEAQANLESVNKENAELVANIAKADAANVQSNEKIAEVGSEKEMLSKGLEVARAEVEEAKQKAETEARRLSSELQVERAAAEAEKARLKSEHDARVAALNAELEAARSEAETANARLADAEPKLAKLQAVNARLAEAELQAVRTELQAVRTELEGEKARLKSEHDARVAALNAELEAARSDAEAKLTEVQVANARLAEVEGEKARLSSELQVERAAAEAEKARLNSEHDAKIVRLNEQLQAEKIRLAEVEEARVAELQAVDARLAEVEKLKVALQTVNEELQAARSEVEGEKISLNGQLQAAKSKLEEVKQNAEAEKARLNEELEAVKQNAEGEKARLNEELQEVNVAAEARLAEAEGEKARLNAELEAVKQKAETETRRVNAELQEVNVAAEARLAEAEGEKVRLNAELEAARSDAEAEKAGLNSEHGAIVVELTNALTKVQSDLARVNKENAQKLNKLQAEHDARVVSLNLDVEAARSELDAVKQNAEAEKVRLQAEHDESVARLAAANERLRESDEAKVELQTANGAVNARILKLEAANARLAKAQEAKVSELQELQAEHDARVVALNAELEAVNERTEARVAEVNAELEAARSDAEAKLTEVQAVNARLVEVEAEKARLKSEHGSLATRLAAVNERLRESDEARANLQEANGAVNARLAEAQANLERVNKENAELVANIAKADAANVESNARLAELEGAKVSELQKFQMERNELVTRLNGELEVEKANFNEQLRVAKSEAEAKIAELINTLTEIRADLAKANIKKDTCDAGTDTVILTAQTSPVRGVFGAEAGVGTSPIRGVDADTEVDIRNVEVGVGADYSSVNAQTSPVRGVFGADAGVGTSPIRGVDADTEVDIRNVEVGVGADYNSVNAQTSPVRGVFGADAGVGSSPIRRANVETEVDIRNAEICVGTSPARGNNDGTDNFEANFKVKNNGSALKMLEAEIVFPRNIVEGEIIEPTTSSISSKRGLKVESLKNCEKQKLSAEKRQSFGDYFVENSSAVLAVKFASKNFNGFKVVGIVGLNCNIESKFLLFVGVLIGRVNSPIWLQIIKKDGKAVQAGIGYNFGGNMFIFLNSNASISLVKCF